MLFLRVNLGGEGEVPGVLNQQPPLALRPSWRSQSRETIAQLVARGIPIVIAPNDRLPFADASVDIVFTNGVPIDTTHPYYGIGVQTSEVHRILRSGGLWIDDGRVRFRQP